MKNQFIPYSLNFSVPSGGVAPANSGITVTGPYVCRFGINPNLQIEKNCSIELTQASFPYSQPNVAAPGQVPSIPTGNNAFGITIGATSFTAIIPTGLYNFYDVQYQMNYVIRSLYPSVITGTVDLITLQGIESTQKILLSINPAAIVGGNFSLHQVTIDFNVTASLGPILGFGISTIVSPPTGTAIFTALGPSIADFGATTAYVINCSLVSNNYLNGNTSQVLRAFPLGQFSTNAVIPFNASIRSPVNCVSGNVSYVDVWLSDQNGSLLPLQFFQGPVQFTVTISKYREDGSI